MKRVIKILAWITLFAGLVLGPGYWLHARYFGESGQDVHPLTRQGADRWQSPVIRLSPEMNPVGLSFRGDWTAPTPAAGAPPLPPPRFQAILRQGEQAAEPMRFQLRDGGKRAGFEERLLLIHVPEAADYQLDIEVFGHPDSVEKLAQPALVVRQNVEAADPRVVAGGILAVALAALVLLTL